MTADTGTSTGPGGRGMWARIHRGANQIGGNCVEVHAEGATILLDLGLPLDAGPGDHVPLPAAVGIGEPGPAPLAVVVTHGHADHWGQIPDLPTPVPVWIGQGAADVLRAAAPWGTGVNLNEVGHLHDRTPVSIGPFRITPYLADHSAFDAYSLLVEAAGQRLLYSGDLRGHGRKPHAFTRLITDPPPRIDTLLLEGTHIVDVPDEPMPPGAGLPSEAAVEEALADTLTATRGLVVVVGSGQNVDRLVTAYRAARRAGRRLAVDLYTAEVAAATGRGSIPRPAPDWPRVAAYLPLRQRTLIKRTGRFTATRAIRPHRVFDENLAADPGGWVLYGAYTGHIPHLIRTELLDGGAVSWSMWHGYLDRETGQRLSRRLTTAGIPLLHHHASGHATATDLHRLADAVATGKIVPIHTEAPHAYPSAFGSRVRLHPDGTWWPVTRHHGVPVRRGTVADDIPIGRRAVA